MAEKRKASDDLNHSNLEKEEELEEEDDFGKASEDKHKTKVAKEQNSTPITASVSKSDEPGNLNNTPRTPVTPIFQFIGNVNKAGFKINSLSEYKTMALHPHLRNTLTENKAFKKADEYYAQLKRLNETASSCVQKYVNTDPFINLKPVFKDYEKYMDNLENEKYTKNYKVFAVEKPKEKTLTSAGLTLGFGGEVPTPFTLSVVNMAKLAAAKLEAQKIKSNSN